MLAYSQQPAQLAARAAWPDPDVWPWARAPLIEIAVSRARSTPARNGPATNSGDGAEDESRVRRWIEGLEVLQSGMSITTKIRSVESPKQYFGDQH